MPDIRTARAQRVDVRPIHQQFYNELADAVLEVLKKYNHDDGVTAQEVIGSLGRIAGNVIAGNFEGMNREIALQTMVVNARRAFGEDECQTQ